MCWCMVELLCHVSTLRFGTQRPTSRPRKPGSLQSCPQRQIKPWCETPPLGTSGRDCAVDSVVHWIVSYSIYSFWMMSLAEKLEPHQGNLFLRSSARFLQWPLVMMNLRILRAPSSLKKTRGNAQCLWVPREGGQLVPPHFIASEQIDNMF